MPDKHLIPVVPDATCTRRHALKVFAAWTGGAVLASRLPAALGGLPWGEIPPADLLTGDAGAVRVGTARNYGRGQRQSQPTLTRGPDGRTLWTSWAQLHEGREAILARSFDPAGEKWSRPIVLSETPEAAAYESEIVTLGDSIVVVWVEERDGSWTLNVRRIMPDTGKAGPAMYLAGGPGRGEVHLHPTLAARGDGALVVWQTKLPNATNFSLRAQRLDANAQPVGGAFGITDDTTQDCLRPSVAASPTTPEYAVAFERQDAPGTQNVYLAMVDATAGSVLSTRRITNHPASDLSPTLAYSPDGEWLWLAWHSNRHGDNGWDITPTCHVAGLRLSDSTWHRPTAACPDVRGNERGTVQGFELTRLAVAPSGLVCVLGRASHNFYVWYLTGNGKAPVYRLPKDGWGGRGRTLQGVFDDDALWVTRRDLGKNTLQRIDGFAELGGPPPVQPFAEAGNHNVVPLAGRHRRQKWPEPIGPTSGLRVYFGDVHGHSWQSDGMGDPESSFRRARDVLQDDFHVLTDHDNFVGKRFSDAEWAEQKALVEHYHRPGEFVPLFGQEWTTPRTNRKHGWGHFNIYSADPTIPLFDHKDPRYRDLPDLYAAIRKYDAIAFPHHIGWTGVRWDEVDTEITPVVEICSVHGAFEYMGNTPIPHRGAMHGNFYRDALAHGLKIGVAGGSDQHGLTWQHGICWKRNAYRAGITGVWAPELSREAVLDAFRKRRTFATTGVKMQLYFAMGEHLMGSLVETDRAPTFKLDVAVTPGEGRIKWLEIIRNGEPWHECGGENQHSRHTATDPDCPVGQTTSYYARITLANNNMAWSSPIWVTRRA